MVSPKLLLLYTSTWKNILQLGGPKGHDLINFSKTLPALREALTCSVCNKLLAGDELYSPSASSYCYHFACKDCKGGDRQEGNCCESCSDWEVYREDETLSFLMQGYRQFCRYFLRSKECTRVLEIKYEVDPEFDAIQLLDLISEGSRQYKTPKSETNNDPAKSVGVVPICRDLITRVKTESQSLEVVLDKEEERRFEIKIEPYDPLQFHNNKETEEEHEIPVVIESGSEIQTTPTSFQLQDPLEDDDEEEEPEEEDDDEEVEEEQEIRSSSLRLVASPPPPPPPPPQTTSIMFQRTPQSSPQHIQISSKQLQSFVLASSSASPTRQIQFSGSRIPGTSTIRLARLSLDGRPLTMVRHLLGQPSASGGVRHTVTLPINASTLAKNKIIVRPATVTATTPATVAHMQKWPDATKVLQYASGGTILRPSITSTLGPPRATYSTVTTSSASSIEYRPQQQQQMTKISLGNMGSVVSTSSIGSVINRPATLTTSSGKIIGTIGTVVRTDGDGTVKKLKVRLPKPKIQPKIRKGCRCGNAATQPGKLTCCGQRCPCYVDAKSCTDCRCRGCRNPHLPGGKKLLQGINAVIDTKTNTTVPFSTNAAAASSSSSSTVVTATASSSNNISTSVPLPIVSSSTMNLVPVSGSQQIYSRIHYPGTTHATTTSFSQLIPLANFGGFSIPISLISPASHHHATTSMSTIQTHSQPIRMHTIQSLNAAMTANIKTETRSMEEK